ncbi:S24 family peptidase [Rhizobium pusense]|uniref:S24 family peptidase n=1 Tax=Agrobacterium pusense TaxID=648995 RepID=UPI00244AB036|nr:S24 family peptidase [Agrobacterium pusense]MDH1093802.1 S24 family peptidase [Agrobacterium pusense]MDH1110302.1 S24 family peptidase [Agrobacterium pusense]MDH2193744.1 S24 family peptidase [Agrobacterium pusense]
MPNKLEFDPNIAKAMSNYEDQWKNLPTRNAALAREITLLVEYAGGRSEAAKVMDVAPTTLDNYRLGKTQPKLLEFERLVAAANENVRGLFVPTISSSMYGDSQASAEGKGLLELIGEQLRKSTEEAVGGNSKSVADGGETRSPSDVVSVQFADLQVSAGHGRVALDEQTDKKIAMSAFLLRQLGLSPSQTLITKVDGDSMYPTISSDGFVVVDRREYEPRDSRIYMVSLAGDLVVKRVRLDLDGGITLTSDNNTAAYPPRRIPPEDLDRVRFIGRVKAAFSPL